MFAFKKKNDKSPDGQKVTPSVPAIGPTDAAQEERESAEAPVDSEYARFMAWVNSKPPERRDSYMQLASAYGFQIEMKEAGSSEMAQ